MRVDAGVDDQRPRPRDGDRTRPNPLAASVGQSQPAGLAAEQFLLVVPPDRVRVQQFTDPLNDAPIVRTFADQIADEDDEVVVAGVEFVEQRLQFAATAVYVADEVHVLERLDGELTVLGFDLRTEQNLARLALRFVSDHDCPGFGLDAQSGVGPTTNVLSARDVIFRVATFGDVLIISFLAGAATGVGALATLVVPNNDRLIDALTGFTTGIVVGAVLFSLLAPALELGSPPTVVAGVLVGAALVLGVNRSVLRVLARHAGRDRPATLPPGPAVPATPMELNRRSLLTGAAVAVNNVPEGLAIGVAFASGLDQVGLALAIAVGIQNVPDGFLVALPAIRAGVAPRRALLYTGLTGGVPEPLAAALGYVVVSDLGPVFPLAAGIAAGAMLSVVFRELVPSSLDHGYADTVTVAFLLGFSTMILVSEALAG